MNEASLNNLQRETFDYFLKEANPLNGLVIDKTAANWPASIAAGLLFIHQLSHIWIDFRGIQDGFMRDKGIDYFENSCRATYFKAVRIKLRQLRLMNLKG